MLWGMWSMHCKAHLAARSAPLASPLAATVQWDISTCETIKYEHSTRAALVRGSTRHASVGWTAMYGSEHAPWQALAWLCCGAPSIRRATCRVRALQQPPRASGSGVQRAARALPTWPPLCTCR